MLIIYLMASPIYIFYHYQTNWHSILFPHHKGGHLLLGVYPCLSSEMGLWSVTNRTAVEESSDKNTLININVEIFT